MLQCITLEIVNPVAMATVWELVTVNMCFMIILTNSCLPKAKERQLVMNFRTNQLSLLGVICMSVSTEINATTTTNNLFEFSDLPYLDSLKIIFTCSLSCQLCNSGKRKIK